MLMVIAIGFARAAYLIDRLLKGAKLIGSDRQILGFSGNRYIPQR